MKKSLSIIFFISFHFNSACQENKIEEKFLFGADVLITEKLELIQNKNVGVVANNPSRLTNGIHLIDTLISLGINVKAIFAPEHGFKGELEAGKLFENSIAGFDNILIYSLYGSTKKPTTEMLEGIDILIFDLQDIGARFYTYISTLFYVLQSSAEYNIPLIVLDRPNPLGGNFVGGPMLDPEYESFIGIAPLPLMHGMTICELSKFFIGEKLIRTTNNPNVTIVKLQGWERDKNWEDLNLDWYSTSPNIPTFETAFIYPSTCLVEGTNISEGRGTEKPFLTLGSPFVNSNDLINKMKKIGLNGIKLTSINFIPVSIKGKASQPKLENEECNGISIKITDYKIFNPVKFGIQLIYTLRNLYPSKFEFRKDHFDKLAGSNKLRNYLEEGKDPKYIISSWREDLQKFNQTRNKYLLY
jgi:uncharacterized protein YbbC (DUF1343 family)